MTRMALVGCGDRKRSCRNCRAYRLYTSSYFKLKRGFAEWCCDEWTVLSAKWGTFEPNAFISPYDVTIDDYPLTDEDAEFRTLDQWASAVIDSLETRFAYHRDHPDHEPVEDLVVLAGQSYLDPLRDGLETLAAHDPHLSLSFPFDATNGHGEQQGWLKTQIVDERGGEYEYLDHLFCDTCGGAARDARYYEPAAENPLSHGTLTCRSCLATHYGLDETTIDHLEELDA